MNIATVVSGSLSSPAGAERCHFALCQELAERGNSVAAILGGEGGIVDQWRDFADHTTLAPRQVTDRKISLGALSEGLEVLLRSRSWRPDCVYVSHPSDIAIVAPLSLIHRTPIVCHLHLPYFGNSSPLFRVSMSLVERFVAVSHATADSWRTAPSADKRLTVVHNGVDTTAFRPASATERRSLRAKLHLSSDARVILYAGRIRRGKGLHVLIDSIRQLVARGVDCQLVVAGYADERDYEQAIRRSAATLPVSWIGWSADPVDIYRAADLVVLPSIWPEPISLVLLEGLASGVPVIASKVGGIPEVLAGDLSSLLVPPGSVEALSSRLVELLEWRGINPGLGTLVRRRIEDSFSLSRSADSLEAVLTDAMRCRSR